MTDEVFEVRPVTDFDSAKVDQFMRKFMNNHRADFLRDHGDWKHRGHANRYVVAHKSTGEMAGYFACTPIELLINDVPQSAVWLMDLFVLPEFRGRGLQRLTDAVGRELNDIQVAFPNPLASGIHRKHGWGVREDYRVVMLPLRPNELPHIERLTGWKRILARSAAIMAEPAFMAYRAWMRRQTGATKLTNPDADHMAAVFNSQNSTWVTVNRTSDYLRWRYLDCPHREQLSFYHYDNDIVMVTRTYNRRNGTRITRILDIFGNLANQNGVAMLIRAAVQEAIREKSAYITALVTNELWHRELKRQGFLLGTVSRFRWISRDPALMQAIENGPCHWCLADSDNDTLD